MQKFEEGEIYLIKFHPGYGSELQKYRPAVVVSSKINQIDSRFTLIAPLTTSIKVFNPDSEIVVKNNPALEKDSILLCWYVWTIDVDRIVRSLGHLSRVDLKLMQKAVKSIF